MPTKLRLLLPKIITYGGMATIVLSLFLALLSTDNPLVLAAFLIGGVSLGAAVAGVGILVENSEASRAEAQQVAANSRAAARATVELMNFLQKTFSASQQGE